MRGRDLFHPRPRRSPVKARNFRRNMGKLFACLKPYRKSLILAASFAAASVLFAVAGPKVLSLAVDELASGAMRIVTGAAGGINFGSLGGILLILGGMYLASALLFWLQDRMTAEVSSMAARDLRERLEEKLHRLPLACFRGNGREDMLSRIVDDVDTLVDFLHRDIGQAVRSFCVLTVTPVLLLTVSWQMLLVALLLLFVGLALALLFARLSRQCKEETAEEEFDKENERLYRTEWRARFLQGLKGPAAGLAGGLGYGILCLAGVALAAGGSLTVGGILACIQYAHGAVRTAVRSAELPGEIRRTAQAAERVFELLSREEETPEEPVLTVKEAKLRGELCFDHVKFGYEDTHELVIRDFSARIPAGWQVAVVGPDGAGKSTLMKLLLRFHELKGGQITVDGRPITDFSRADLRSAFSMVPEDNWLCGGTVLDNLRYGKPDATEEEAIEAAKAAQADGLIQALPDGYRTMLTGEDVLSRAQKRLLSIARAILRDAPMVILEEDEGPEEAETEELIQKATERLTKGRTSLILARRPSTVRNADLVLCMKDGDLVEQGTHWELMVKGGYYAQLYSRQIETKGIQPGNPGDTKVLETK